jgi:hypothetical protein
MRRLLDKPAIKKLAVIILSFIPAFIALSIINVIFTYAFYLSGSTTSSLSSSKTANNKSRGGSNKKKQVVKKTVYVEPSNDDLEKLLIELEESEPLPVVHYDSNQGRESTKRAQTVISSLQSLMGYSESSADDDNDNAASKDMDDLSEAYETFITRFNEDIDHIAQGEEASAEILALEHLPQFMKRKSLLDLDTKSMEVLFQNVIEDLHLLLKNDDMLRNSNQTLMTLLNGGIKKKKQTSKTHVGSCDSTYLDLGKGNPSSELKDLLIATATAAAAAGVETDSSTKKAVKVDDDDDAITEDTARQSDLYERIAYFKEILSRRDISSNNTATDPIDEVGVAEVRSQVQAMALTLLKKRQAGIARDAELKQQSVQDGLSSQPDDGGGSTMMCASPTMVEKMVQQGLDSIRGQGDLQSTLITTVFSAIADESDDVEFKQIMDALNKDMEEIDIPKFDYRKKIFGEEIEPGLTKKTSNKKTLSYVIDGPILHRGVAGRIDSLVELISGYNDHVDELFDYIMSRQGVSVGTATADAVAAAIRKVPLPDLERLTKSGILGGRIRSLIEE